MTLRRIRDGRNGSALGVDIAWFSGERDSRERFNVMGGLSRVQELRVTLLSLHFSLADGSASRLHSSTS